MSRIGKKPVAIPEKTEVSISDKAITVKGKEGTLTRRFGDSVTMKVENGTVIVEPVRNDQQSMANWGTWASHASNMIAGVNKVFQKKLIIEGIGFKADVKGDEITLNLGFSHQVKMKIPVGLKVLSEKGGVLSIAGPDIELVGQFAEKVRILKKPEPYKGKGIRYEGEVIRRKQGKKTA